MIHRSLWCWVKLALVGVVWGILTPALVSDALLVLWHRPVGENVLLRAPYCAQSCRWESDAAFARLRHVMQRNFDVKESAMFYVLLQTKACSWTTACCSWSASGSLMPTMTSTLTTTWPALCAWRTCSVCSKSTMHECWTNGWKDG